MIPAALEQALQAGMTDDQKKQVARHREIYKLRSAEIGKSGDNHSSVPVMSFLDRIGARAKMGLEGAGTSIRKEIPGLLVRPFDVEKSNELFNEGAAERDKNADLSRQVGGGILGGAAQVISEAAPSMIGPVGAARIGAGVAGNIARRRILGATAKKVSEKAAKASIAKARKAGAVATSAAVSGLQSGSSTFNEAFQKYKREGMSEADAGSEAILPALLSFGITAGVTGKFGATGAENLGRVWGNGLGAGVKEILKQGGLEGVEEMTDEIFQSASAVMTYNPEMTVGQALSQTAMAFGVGGLMGAGFSALDFGKPLDEKIKGPEDKPGVSAIHYQRPVGPLLGLETSPGVSAIHYQDPIGPVVKPYILGASRQLPKAGDPESYIAPYTERLKNEAEQRGLSEEDTASLIQRFVGTVQNVSDLNTSKLNTLFRFYVNRAKVLSNNISFSEPIVTSNPNLSKIRNQIELFSKDSIAGNTEFSGVSEGTWRRVLKEFDQTLLDNPNMTEDEAETYFTWLIGEAAQFETNSNPLNDDDLKTPPTKYKKQRDVSGNVIDVEVDQDVNADQDQIVPSVNSQQTQLGQAPVQANEQTPAEQPVPDATPEPIEEGIPEGTKPEIASAKRADKKTKSKFNDTATRLVTAIKAGKDGDSIVSIETSEDGKTSIGRDENGEPVVEIEEIADEKSNFKNPLTEIELAKAEAAMRGQYKTLRTSSVLQTIDPSRPPARFQMRTDSNGTPIISVRDIQRLYKIGERTLLIRVNKEGLNPEEILNGITDTQLKHVPKSERAEFLKEIKRNAKDKEAKYYAPLPWSMRLNLPVTDFEGDKIRSDSGRTDFEQQDYIPYLQVKSDSKYPLVVGIFLNESGANPPTGPVLERKFMPLYRASRKQLGAILSQVTVPTGEGLNLNGEKVKVSTEDQGAIVIPSEILTESSLREGTIWSPVNSSKLQGDLRSRSESRSLNVEAFAAIVRDELYKYSKAIAQVFDSFAVASEEGFRIFDYIIGSTTGGRDPKNYAKRIVKAFRKSFKVDFNSSSKDSLYSGQVAAIKSGEPYSPPKQGSSNVLRPAKISDSTKGEYSVELMKRSIDGLLNNGINNEGSRDALTQYIFDITSTPEFEKWQTESEKKTQQYMEDYGEDYDNDNVNSVEQSLPNLGLDRTDRERGRNADEATLKRESIDRSMLNQLMDENSSLTLAQRAKKFAENTSLNLASVMLMPRMAVWALTSEPRAATNPQFDEARAEALAALEVYNPQNATEAESIDLAKKIIKAYIESSKVERMSRRNISGIKQSFRADKASNISSWVYRIKSNLGDFFISTEKKIPLYSKGADDVGRFATIGGDANIVSFDKEVFDSATGDTYYEYTLEDSMDRARKSEVKRQYKVTLPVVLKTNTRIQTFFNEEGDMNVRVVGKAADNLPVTEFSENFSVIPIGSEGFKKTHDIEVIGTSPEPTVVSVDGVDSVFYKHKVNIPGAGKSHILSTSSDPASVQDVVSFDVTSEMKPQFHDVGSNAQKVADEMAIIYGNKSKDAAEFRKFLEGWADTNLFAGQVDLVIEITKAYLPLIKKYYKGIQSGEVEGPLSISYGEESAANTYGNNTSTGEVEISRVINNPEIGFTQEQRNLYNALIESLGDSAPDLLDALKISLYNGTNGTNVSGSFTDVGRTASILIGAKDSKNVVHEIAHSLERFIPSFIRRKIQLERAKKLSELEERLISPGSTDEAVSRSIVGEIVKQGSISSKRFIELVDSLKLDNPQAIVDMIYPLINDSEFFAAGMANKIESKIINAERGLFVRILEGIVNAVKRVFGRRDVFDQVLDRFKKGKYEQNAQNGPLFEQRYESYHSSLRDISPSRIGKEIGRAILNNDLDAAQSIASDAMAINKPTIEFTVNSIVSAIPGAEEFFDKNGALIPFTKITQGEGFTDQDRQRYEDYKAAKKLASELSLSSALDVHNTVDPVVTDRRSLFEKMQTFVSSGHPELANLLAVDAHNHWIRFRARLLNIIKKSDEKEREYSGPEFAKLMIPVGKAKIKLSNMVEASKEIRDSIARRIEYLMKDARNRAEQQGADDTILQLGARYKRILDRSGSVSDRVNEFSAILNNDPDFRANYFFGSKGDSKMVAEMKRILKGNINDDIDKLALELLAFEKHIRDLSFSNAVIGAADALNLQADYSDISQSVEDMIGKKVGAKNIKKFINEAIRTGSRQGEAAMVFKAKMRKLMKFLNEREQLEKASNAAKSVLASPEFNETVSRIQKMLGAMVQPEAVGKRKGAEGEPDVIERRFKDFGNPESIDVNSYIPVPRDNDDPEGLAEVITLTAYSHESENTEEVWGKKSEKYMQASKRISKWLKRNPNSIHASYYEAVLDKLNGVILSGIVQDPGSEKSTILSRVLSVPKQVFKGLSARSAKIAEIKFDNFDKAFAFITKQTSKYKNRISNLNNKAAQSHFGGAKDIALEDWRDQVWRELSSSYQGGKVALNAGDRLRNGLIVTKEDIAAIRAQQEFESLVVSAMNAANSNKRINLGGSKGTSVEDIVKVGNREYKTYRNIVETQKGMLHRRFNFNGISLAKSAMEAFDAHGFNSNSDELPVNSNSLMSILNDEDFLYSFLNDRLPGFAPNLGKDLQNEDNLELIYKEYAASLKSSGSSPSLQALIEIIAQKKVDEKRIPIGLEKAELYLLKDLLRAVKPVGDQYNNAKKTYLEGMDEEAMKVHESRANDVKVIQMAHFNSFSQARQDQIVPDFFYDYGFANERDFYSYSHIAPSYFFNETMKSMDFAIDDYNKAFNELDKVQKLSRRKGDYTAAKEHLAKMMGSSEDIKNMDVFHIYDRLKDDLDALKKLKSELSRVFGPGGDYVDLAFKGPLLDRFNSHFVETVISSHRTVMRPIFEPLVIHAKLLKRIIGVSGYKTAPWEIIKPITKFTLSHLQGGGLFRVPKELAVGLKDFISDSENSLSFSKNWGGAWSRIAQGLIKDAIDTRILEEAGLTSPMDVVSDIDSLLLNPLNSGGRAIPSPTRDKGLLSKGVHGVSNGIISLLAGTIVTPIFSPIFPRVGDEVANSIAMNMGMKGVSKIEKNLRKLYLKFKDLGEIPLDLNDPSNPENNGVITPSMFYGRNNSLSDQLAGFNQLRTTFADAGILSFDVEVAKFFKRLQNAEMSGASTKDVQFLSHEDRIAVAAVFPKTLNIPTPGNRSTLQKKNKTIDLMTTLMGYSIGAFANMSQGALTKPMKKDPNYWLGYVKLGLVPAMLETIAMVGLAGVGEAIVQAFGEVVDETVFGEKINKPQPLMLAGQGRYKEAALTYADITAQTMPLIGSAISTFITDTPYRVELSPFKLLRSKSSDVLEYVTGAYRTGDPMYRIDKLAESAVGPWGKVITSQMLYPGFEKNLNMRRLITTYAPEELRRPPNYGSARTSQYTRVTPYGSKIIEALMNKDVSKARELMNEAIKIAVAEGDTPSRARDRIESAVLAQNPWRRLKTSPSYAERTALLKSMPERHREYLIDAETDLVRGASSLGINMRTHRNPRTSGGGFSVPPPSFSTGRNILGREGRTILGGRKSNVMGRRMILGG